MKATTIMLPFAALMTGAALSDTIGTDFEGVTPPALPAGWQAVGSGVTTAASGNPGNNLNAASGGTSYLVNSGIAFDAAQAISGTFDFYIVESGNYSNGAFFIGDVQGGLGSTAGSHLRIDLRERTFGARANILDGAGTTVFSGAGNNQYRIDTNTWISATFSWTPTSGTTGDFSFSWTYPAQPNRGPMTVTGHTFDSNEVFFGFGTVDDEAWFDNISITGTPVGGTPPAGPEITSISVSGTTATIVMTGEPGTDYYCAGSGDLVDWSNEVVPTDTAGSPFQTDGNGDLTFSVDVSGFGPGYYLRVQESDPAP